MVFYFLTILIDFLEPCIKYYQKYQILEVLKKRILESIVIRRLLGLSLGFASSSSSTQLCEEVLLIAENENSSKSWTPCHAWGEEWGGNQMSSSIYFACNHTCCLVTCHCHGNIPWRCFMLQFIIAEPVSTDSLPEEKRIMLDIRKYFLQNT